MASPQVYDADGHTRIQYAFVERDWEGKRLGEWTANFDAGSILIGNDNSITQIIINYPKDDHWKYDESSYIIGAQIQNATFRLTVNVTGDAAQNIPNDDSYDEDSSGSYLEFDSPVMSLTLPIPYIFALSLINVMSQRSAGLEDIPDVVRIFKSS